MTEPIEGLTPREIVDALDGYIIGQVEAKRAVAVALRNRYRRRRLPEELQNEVIPKNILMIGPTGVGKTEIARRLASLDGAPFVKVEATKFTEVGYVGRDVDSMIRDLAQDAYRIASTRRLAAVKDRARGAVIDRIVDILEPLPQRKRSSEDIVQGFQEFFSSVHSTAEGSSEEDSRFQDQVRRKERLRERLRREIEAGERDLQVVEIQVQESAPRAPVEVIGIQGLEDVVSQIRESLGGKSPRSRKVTIAEAKQLLLEEEARKLVDDEEIRREAVELAEESGIVFIDEIDKITGRSAGQGPDVSREGVQRDILPIIEGSVVNTRQGPVRTDHILFIAAGAFHLTRPSDLIPELQGRLPIRVQLAPLTQADFRRILIEPQNALLKQYAALLATEGVTVTFEPGAVDAISRLAFEVNESTENIGARRLHTILEKLLEDLSFHAPERRGDTEVITAAYVEERLARLVTNQDRSRFIL